MIFNSATFGVFLILVFFIYWKIVHRSLRLQNVFILLSSYVFYGWWDIRFLSLILVSSLVDYTAGQKIAASTSPRMRKTWLGLSLIINLGILATFKYFDFFVLSFQALLEQFGFHASWSTLNLILPVGISFYTFQTLSYTIDIYRKQLSPTCDWVAFFAFVAFFPQLVAGPIERAKRLLPQFTHRRIFSQRMAIQGCRLFLWGLFKKTVIADNLAVYVDLIYGQPEGFHGWTVILATVFFAFQVYCDFSGYSDMAIGTGRLLGFDLMTNFRTPYFSKSFREFWHRWHISLSTWFRDYVYIPLGGNRGSLYRHLFNLILTFILSGLWHGANFTFLAWGALHGFFISIELLLGSRTEPHFKVPDLLKIVATFCLVSLAWVFFRSDNIGDAFVLLQNIFMLETSHSLLDIFDTQRQLIYLSLCLFIFLTLEILMKKEDFNQWITKQSRNSRWMIYHLLMISILLFGNFDNAPNFIYFQF